MITTDYLLDNTTFNLISLNPIYQLDSINPIEADFYNELSSINTSTDSFVNPILTSQYNILNLNNSIGYMQTAYNTLEEITPFVNKLTELSSQIDNPSIQKNMQDLYNQINYYIDNATYNGVNVFNQDIQIGDTTIKLELPSLDITDPDSIENFAKQVDLLKDDIKNYLETSSLYSDNFVNNLMTEIYPQTDFDLLNQVNSTNLQITADLLAVAHNQDYLSQTIEQLLF